jgi:hypothetical protein
MVAIASFYVVFAIQSGDTLEIAVHTGLAASFAALAIIGARTSSWILAAALLGHGIFDVFAGSVIANPAPGWWGPFCLGIDVVLALALAAMLWRGRTLDRENLPRRFLQQPDQLIEFGALFFRVATLDRGFDAMFGMVLQHQLLDAKDRRPDRGRLGQDVHAVAVTLDHLGDTTHLSFKPRQAVQRLFLVGLHPVALLFWNLWLTFWLYTPYGYIEEGGNGTSGQHYNGFRRQAPP